MTCSYCHIEIEGKSYPCKIFYRSVCKTWDGSKVTEVPSVKMVVEEFCSYKCAAARQGENNKENTDD